MESAVTIGLDIAKWVFQLHGVGVTGNVVVQVLRFFAVIPACLVGVGGVRSGALLGPRTPEAWP